MARDSSSSLVVHASEHEIPHSGKLSPLSFSLWRNNPLVDSDQEFDPTATLTWKDLQVTVSTRKGEKQKVLHGLTGYAEPGSILAIMGPSGSGKSTLLDSLAGRLAKNATLSGEILVNGRRKTLSYGSAAYVTQQDELIGTLTVRESIRYSADLRLPRSIPKEEKSALVESTILEMGLQDCADTPIGNWHLRGLSGGEKRRLSIGLEILTRPRLLFLDEPTSGLDSASAFFVLTTLKNLAADGRTLIASIHQPSSEVFELFDMLCLLSNGRAVYFGEAQTAHEFFSSAGFPCPALRNPSDHFLRAINADFDLVKNVKFPLRESFRRRGDVESSGNLLDRMSTVQVVQVLLDSYRQSEYAMATAAHVHEVSKIRGTVLDSAGSLAGFLMQSWTLTRRSFVNMSRDMGYYWLRLAVYVVLSVCIGTIYLDVGNSFTSIQGRSGCISYVVGFLTFMSIGGFPSFVEDMKVFSRERLNGYYGVGAFVIGNTLSSLPFLFLIALASSAIVYFMVGLHPGFAHFAYFVLTLFVCVACVESLMMAVASVVPNFLMGIITGAGIQVSSRSRGSGSERGVIRIVPFAQFLRMCVVCCSAGVLMLVCGFFRLPLDLPSTFWRYPMFYISFHMYALQGMYQNDFLGLQFENSSPDDPPLQGRDVLKVTYQVDLTRSKWVNVVVIAGMVLFYRLLFFLLIKVAEQMRPFVRAFAAKKGSHRRASKSTSGRIAPPPSAQAQNSNMICPVQSSPSPAHEHSPLQHHQYVWAPSPSPQHHQTPRTFSAR